MSGRFAEVKYSNTPSTIAGGIVVQTVYANGIPFAVILTEESGYLVREWRDGKIGKGVGRDPVFRKAMALAIRNGVQRKIGFPK